MSGQPTHHSQDGIAWKYGLGAGVCVVLLLMVLVQFESLWWWLGVGHITPYFSDLVAILAAGEAHVRGWDVYQHNPLDPYNRPHVYGPWWLMLGDIGLGRADTWWLGLTLAGLFLMAALLVLKPRNNYTVVLAVLMMVSPGVLLAVERGNNDLVIFLLLTLAAWLVTRRQMLSGVAGAGLVLLSAALKLYPLAAVPALAAKDATRKRLMLLLGGTVLAVAMVLVLSWSDYRRTAELAPEPLTIFGYGAKLSGLIWAVFPRERVWLLVGALPLIAGAAWVGWRWRRSWWTLLSPTGFTTACYLAGGLCWCLCWVSTINFPYRMVLLLLPARLWLAEVSDPNHRFVARVHLLLALLLWWSPLAKNHLLVLNPVTQLYEGTPLTFVALGAEHALGLVVTVLLGLVITGWAWRRLKEDECN